MIDKFATAAAQILGRTDFTVTGVMSGSPQVILPDRDVTAQELADIISTAALVPPSREDVNAERDRRIDGRFAFGGHIFQSDTEARENISGASAAAIGAIMLGAQAGDLRWHGGDEDFAWLALDNTSVPMDAPTVYAFGMAAMRHKSDHIWAARALKDADPTPADFADDSHWPVPPAV